MLLLRVQIPDRPGQLGAVASAMGTVGADILAVEIVERLDDAVIDDFMLELPDGRMPDSLVSACEALHGVSVHWLSRYPETWNLESDVEILTRMLDDPEHAAELLTDAAPVVFHCHWAFLADRRTGRILAGTSLAPELTPAQLGLFGSLEVVRSVQLADGWLPHWGEATCALAPVAPDRVIVLGRQGGPAWLDSELGRLRLLVAMSA